MHRAQLAPPVTIPADEPQLRRARRPAAHYLTLPQIEYVIACAWELGSLDHTSYANAMRTEVAIMTGLRGGELHNLRPKDINPDGTITIRNFPGLKRAKPRVAAFINGLAESPTRAKLIEWARRRRPTDSLFPTTHGAWSHWVTHRLAPLTGLQRRIECLNGNRTIKRYLIHPHGFRASFVLVCRRLPRTITHYSCPWCRYETRQDNIPSCPHDATRLIPRRGEPIPWETICDLGGWDSVDTIRRHYYFADLDESLDAVRRALPPDLFQHTLPTTGFRAKWRTTPHEKKAGKGNAFTTA